MAHRKNQANSVFVFMELSQEFITASQAAKLTGYNPDYFSSLIREGKVRGRKVGKIWVTTHQEVDRFLKRKNNPSFWGWPLHIGLTARSLLVAFLIAAFLSIATYSIYAAIYNATWSQLAATATAAATVNASNVSQPLP